MAKPGDSVFCVYRKWAHGDEHGFMKKIEDSFQDIARNIIINGTSSISQIDRHRINEFFALWYMRDRVESFDNRDLQLNILKGDPWTKEQEENLESNGYSFVNQSGALPVRFVNSIKIRSYIYRGILPQLENVQWGVIRAGTGEFLVPDVPANINTKAIHVIPLTPTQSLVANHPDGSMDSNDVMKINRGIWLQSENYYFARDLSKCPLW